MLTENCIKLDTSYRHACTCKRQQFYIKNIHAQKSLHCRGEQGPQSTLMESFEKHFMYYYQGFCFCTQKGFPLFCVYLDGSRKSFLERYKGEVLLLGLSFVFKMYE